MIAPYFQHGDCRDVLPQLPHVGTVHTDPVWPNSLPELAGSDRPWELFAEAMELVDADRLSVQLGADSDPRFLRGVPDRYPFVRVVWLEYAVPHYKGRVLAGAEPAYLFGQIPRSRRGVNHVIGGYVLDNRGVGKKHSEHPTPRSPFHTKWVVERWTNPEDTVLDPFMGGGTTLKAAYELRRPAIGIEINEAFCELAASQFDQAVLV